MKNIEEYDKHLQDFYAQSFRDYALKYDMSGAERYANDMLQSYGDAINNTLAQELLKNLNIQYPKLEDKLENYPSLFWGSKEGENILVEIGSNLNKKEMDFLYNKKDLNVEDVTESFKKVTTMAFKISLKNEAKGVRLVKTFESNLDFMLGHKVQEQQIDEVTAKQLHDNAIKQSLNHKNLESHHNTFPELSHVLGNMLHSVTNNEERQNRRTLKVN